MELSIYFGAAIALCLAMGLAWAAQRRTGRSGWIDTIWSAAVGLVGIGVALAPAAGAYGRGALGAVLVALWSARLAFHIAARTRGAAEDPRYADLMQQWGDAGRRRLFWFLQAQAAAAFVLVASIRLAAVNPAPFRAADALAVAIFVVALAGETLADRQLQRFRQAHRETRGLCQDGLWAWSRHPNYFFEWLGWLAYPLLAISGANPLGWLALAAPLLMYLLLVHVSGIPPLETHLALTHGEAFHDLQARVSAFFPLPPRPREAAPSNKGATP